VVWSSDRSSALRKLRACLSEYNIVGLNTNVDFLMQLSSHPQFVEGDVHTDFIDQHYQELFPVKPVTDGLVSQAVLASMLHEMKKSSQAQGTTKDPHNPFTAYPMARLNHSYQKTLKITSQDSSYDVQITSRGNAQFKLKVGKSAEVDVGAKLLEEDGATIIELNSNGEITKSRVVFMEGNIHLFTKVIITFLQYS